jgi:hypothetical protein
MTIWYISCSFGSFFWYHAPRKIWQPCLRLQLQKNGHFNFFFAGRRNYFEPEKSAKIANGICYPNARESAEKKIFFIFQLFFYEILS